MPPVAGTHEPKKRNHNSRFRNLSKKAKSNTPPPTEMASPRPFERVCPLAEANTQELTVAALVALPAHDFYRPMAGTTARTRDLCRDSREEARNLLTQLRLIARVASLSTWTRILDPVRLVSKP
jgi:hypothetical protein